ncbi:hypothetical protein TNCV_1686161 [Trichonephila clavipes]|nr:hypothetical protein TNCV_1686161 [Trichonephila clavipes]
MALNSKQKHNVLNIETKLEILNRLTRGESGAPLTQFYNVEESYPVDDEMDEDEDNNNESRKGPSNADVFSVFERSMEWY